MASALSRFCVTALFHGSNFPFNNSGSLAMFTAMRRASSRVSSFAADCRPRSSSQ
jgi:hypothetical protein